MRTCLASSIVLMLGASSVAQEVISAKEMIPQVDAPQFVGYSQFAETPPEQLLEPDPGLPAHPLGSSCPTCGGHDCCKTIKAPKIVWKRVLYKFPVTTYEVEETGQEPFSYDRCENGVCTQVDGMKRVKQLVPHQKTIKVPGLKPVLTYVSAKKCFKCKRTHQASSPMTSYGS